MTVIQDERGWVKKLMINHKKPPFDDRRFRQALAYAINRQEIIERSQRGFGTPASYGLLSLDHEMYNPDTPVYAHDPEKARALIAGLGYTKGVDVML
jgi:peptide/nickel transport system substrate-binding protein